MPDTKISALTAASAAALANEFAINEAGTSKKLTLEQIQDLIGIKKKRLTGNATSSSATPAKVTGLDLTTGTGVFTFQYFLRYRSSVAGTGVKFDVNHSGTVTSFVWWQRMVDVSATASTNAADQDAIQAAGHVMSAMASRAKGTAGRGTTISVDTQDLDMFMMIEGLFTCTVSGDIQLYFGSEAGASGTQTLMADSVLVLTEFL